MSENFWMIEIYSDDTANVSITSKDELDILREDGDLDEWQFEPCSEVSEEDMIERAEEKGYEHDPW